MKKIASFTVNHDTLTRGMYISRVDADVVTYDIRIKLPNGGDYLENDAMHTFEHLFATFARNSKWSDQVIYVGPMGCRTGFYLLVRDLSPERVLDEVIKVLDLIAYHSTEMFGATRKECGNYRELSLKSAQAEAASYLNELRSHPHDFKYPNNK